jgi:tetratricopeptide (TPR) repeat protein
MALSEIEKLERRYAENPQGLTFAPLAEVHRKNGEVQRALELLGPGLQVHPDYIPASIVLGRCHMDLGDVHSAETAFLHVLDLDGENVIALKALADISERLLKFDDAERWLHTLLTVDRSNDDAREQLQRVEIARRQAGVASSAEPSSVLEEAAAADTAAAAEPAVAPIPDIAPAPPPFQPPQTEPAAASLGFADLEPSAMRNEFLEEPSGIRPAESATLEEPVEPLDGLVGREVDTPDEVTPVFRDDDLRDDVGDFRGDFRVETSEDIILQSAGGSEFQMPDASQELFAAGARGERAPFEEDAPAPSAARTPEPETAESKESGIAESSEAGRQAPEPYAPEPYTPAPYTPGPYTPEPYRTERYDSEPHRTERYEPEPFEDEPFEPEPPAPLPEPEPLAYEAPPAEPSVAEASAPEPVTQVPPGPEPVAPEPVVAAQPAAAPPKRAYGVGDTGGRSVNQLFQGILAARPPMQAFAAPVRQPPPAGTAGAPTRPAADALSLSSVFGEETSETPPAVPAPNTGAGSVTFDDFFGSPSASPAARTPRAPDPKSDDLDQFHAWLQNLKR